jgi:chain length determinant protein EpsF
MMLMPWYTARDKATQEDIIKSDRVTQKVIKTLGLDHDAALQEQWQKATDGKGKFEGWLAARLHRKLSINPTRRDGNIISIEYKAPNPAMAAAVANTFAQAYVEAMAEMKVEPLKQFARSFGEQGRTLRENLERAHARLSEFQQQKGIVVRDETLDAETAKLNELTSRLTAIQAQTVDARSKQRSGSDAEALPEVLANTLIQGLRSDIVRLEAKMKDASGNLGRNHPQYRSMEAELAELKARLEAETRHVVSGFSAARSVGTEKEKELQAAIEAQRGKLLALRSERDELGALQRDVDLAKYAYTEAERRSAQTTLESGAIQTNAFVLRPAVAPLEPSSPKILLNTLEAILGGTLLGLGAAYLLEMRDRRVRCVDDLAELVQMPVIGVIQRSKKSVQPYFPPPNTPPLLGP